ncbi:MAG: PAS domain S-box protein, partial [Thermoguttaceae bacterium]
MNTIIDRAVVTAAVSGDAQSEESLRTFFEQAPLGYQALDEDGNLIDVNQTWLDLLGYEEKADVVGRWFGDFLTPGDQKRFLQHFSDFKAADEIHG